LRLLSRLGKGYDIRCSFGMQALGREVASFLRLAKACLSKARRTKSMRGGTP
jgi:hypothetical protein